MVVSLRVRVTRWLTHKKTNLKAGGTMPKKASAKGAKKSDKEKKPTRPTRCDESFRWTPRPPLVEAAATNNTARLVAAQVPVKCLLLLLSPPPPPPAHSIKTLLARGEKPEDALHYAIGRGKLEVREQQRFRID